MLVGDVLAVTVRPRRGFAALGTRSLLPSVAIVVATGLAALGLNLVATALEPDSPTRSADVGFSIVLPLLFAGFWLIDGLIVDAVSQALGASTRLRRWLAASAYAIPVLLVYGVIRIVQALLDRGGQQDVGVGLGFLDFLVLGWFLGLIAVGIRTVYDLPAISALAAALAPPASMAALLLVLLVVATAAHLLGAG